MSQAHIEQFYGVVTKDAALFNKMMAGAAVPDDFLANAVKEGSAMGYSFTVPEAKEWIDQQKAIAASGELSDRQLEDVAGGKGSGGAALGRGTTAAANAGPLSPSSVTTAGSAFDSLGQDFKNMFTGW
jgi:hypothetical protein